MIERLNIQPVSVIVHMDRYLIGPENLSLNAKEEFAELCRSSGSSIGAEVFGKIDKPTSKYFIKQGKAEEIKRTVKELSADLVIFNNSLTPSQERNLERLFETRVLDRTSLIRDGICLTSDRTFIILHEIFMIPTWDFLILDRMLISQQHLFIF